MKDLIIQESRRLLGSMVFFYPLFKLKSPHNLIDRSTDIVIEGAPSSGNSFAYKAFKIAQNKSLNIAHHKHLPLQIKLACKWRIPCLVLIRKPLDAVCSFLSRYNLQVDSLESRIRFDCILNYWITFYKNIYNYRDQYILCDFEQLIANYADIIEKVNSFYGTHYILPNKSSYELALRGLDAPVKPNESRSKLKYELKEWALNEERFQDKIQLANNLYNKFIGRS